MTTQLHEVAYYTAYLFKGFWASFPIKAIWSLGITIFGFFFGFELNTVLAALMALIFMDFATGILCAYRLGEPIRSRMALRSAVKLAVYGLLVSGAHLTEVVIPGSTFMDDGMIAFLAITEMISIIENAGKMGFAVPQRLLNQLEEWRGEGGNRRAGPPTRRDEIVIPLTPDEKA